MIVYCGWPPIPPLRASPGPCKPDQCKSYQLATGARCEPVGAGLSMLEFGDDRALQTLTSQALPWSG